MHLGDAARLWRERAENARTIARQMTDPEARLGMLEIARDYAIMAEYAERRARGALAQADEGEPEQTAALEIGWHLPQRNLVQGMTFQPDTLKVLCVAFDVAWASLASTAKPEESDAMRNRLANCLLSLSADASTDINALAAEALQALDAM